MSGASEGRNGKWWHYDHLLRIGRIQITARVNTFLERRPVLLPAGLLGGGAVLVAAGLVVGYEAGASNPASGILMGAGALGLVFGLGTGAASFVAYLAGPPPEQGEEGYEHGRGNGGTRR